MLWCFYFHRHQESRDKQHSQSSQGIYFLSFWSTTYINFLKLAFLWNVFELDIVMTECQKLFSFLPLRYQVDIRTASFMLRFMTTENSICHLFAMQAARILTDIYILVTVRTVDSINSLKDAILRQFTGIWVLLLVFVCFLLIILVLCVYK